MPVFQRVPCECTYNGVDLSALTIAGPQQALFSWSGQEVGVTTYIRDHTHLLYYSMIE